MTDYPKQMFRHKADGERIQGVHVEHITVGDAGAEKAAKDHGYHLTPADAGEALKAQAVKPAKPEKSSDDPRPALRAEYKALTGKNAFGGWDADTLSEKIAAAKK